MEVTQPEDLSASDMTLVPTYETERTATPLLALQDGVALVLGTTPDHLVQIAGAVCKQGQTGIYGRLPYPGAGQYQAVVVGWKQDGKDRFSAVEHDSEDMAHDLYEAAVARLDTDD
jgi:hypothetical protein